MSLIKPQNGGKMIQRNYLEDNADLRFNIEHFIRWNEIVPVKEKEFKDAKAYAEKKDPAYEMAPATVEDAMDLYQSVFEQFAEIAGKEVAGAAISMDKTGLKYSNGKVTFPPELMKLVDLIAQTGMIGYAVDRKYGGLAFPFAAQSVIQELLSRADTTFSIVIGCFNLAEVVNRFGDEEMKAKYLPRMTSGEMIGAMALTEPDYGSDLPHIRTSARKNEDGTFTIEGTKRFITHGCGVGDRPAAILTLARSTGQGAKGLSFFLVESDDIWVDRIEEKIGLHTSPTCEIVYDNSKAYLIGEEGKGLVKYAMDMMNGARLGIAIQSVGLATAALEEAKKYASEREQFGKKIQEIMPVARSLNDMDATLQAMRALTYRTSEIVDLLEGNSALLEEHGVDEKSIRKDEKVAKWDKLARLMTPLSKYFCSEKANLIAYHSLSVFGGSGYTEEYSIAKLYRDARITTIYEGTSNLQVVAAIGGITEGAREGSVLDAYLNEVMVTVTEASHKSILEEYRKKLYATVLVYKDLDKDVKEAYAKEMVDFFAHLYTLMLLAEQYQIAKSKNLADFVSMKEKAFQTYKITAIREMESAKKTVELLATP